MSEIKHILVVDDHFEMLEFLRSTLELADYECQVLAVPSAEEALLEIQLAQFDLLITDVRLPGMSGFDLVRRAKKRRPEMPVIMLTGYRSDQGQQEAEELGVYRYFGKPIDADVMLTTVQHALFGEPEPVEEAVVSDLPEVTMDVEVDLSPDTLKRLDSLLTDTGAMCVTLMAAGKVVHETGVDEGLDLQKMASVLTANWQNNLRLEDDLGGGELFSLQYQTGRNFELYTVNVGVHYLVSLFFDISAQRGRIGTVWMFVQRAVRDLLAVLPEPRFVDQSTAVTPSSSATPTKVTPPTKDTSLETNEEIELVPNEFAPDILPNLDLLAQLEEEKEDPVDEPLQLSAEEMAAFESLFTADTSISNTSSDLDSFWDEAITDSDEGGSQQALSLEDAQRLGLINFGGEVSTSVDAVPAKATPEPTKQTSPKPDVPEPEPLSSQQLADFEQLFATTEMMATSDADDFWDSAVASTDLSGGQQSGMSLAEAQKMGLVQIGGVAPAPTPTPPAQKEEAKEEPSLPELNKSELDAFASLFDDSGSKSVDLDAFWETASEEAPVESSQGISLEEARKRGLIP